nr:CAP domain-containing protein [Pseudochelatococcus lubricantis]
MAGFSLTKAALLACLALGLSSCAEKPPVTGVAPFYRQLDRQGAAVDANAAAEILSAYRRNHGLGPLAVDPALTALAQASASSAARADKPASADALKARLTAAGVKSPGINLSAGYRTLAEAFSGWRESPQHNRVLLQNPATRFGIATAYAPGSKYKVYWALVVAGP